VPDPKLEDDLTIPAIKKADLPKLNDKGNDLPS
jgi:hypothetical protein